MTADVASKDAVANFVGAISRVAVTGQEYRVVAARDDETVLIEVASWPEPLPYPVRQVEFDLAGVSDVERFRPLVGQVRSMGPDGPRYEVMSIETSTMAAIWVIGDDRNMDYEIQDVLIDPIVSNTG
jgi:hypothetical protein